MKIVNLTNSRKQVMYLNSKSCMVIEVNGDGAIVSLKRPNVESALEIVRTGHAVEGWLASGKVWLKTKGKVIMGNGELTFYDRLVFSQDELGQIIHSWD